MTLPFFSIVDMIFYPYLDFLITDYDQFESYGRVMPQRV